MRTLMITGGICMLHMKLVKFFHVMFPEQSKHFYTYHTELSCNLLSSSVPGTIFETNIFLILCVKCYMMVNTMKYLELDHDSLKKIALLVLIGFNVIERLILLYFYGTLCPSVTLYKIESDYNVNVSEIEKLPPIIPIHLIFLGLPEVVYRIIMLRKGRKQRR